MALSLLQVINQGLTPVRAYTQPPPSVPLSSDVQNYPRIDESTQRVTPPLVNRYLDPLGLEATQFLIGGFLEYRPGPLFSEQDVIDYSTNELLNPMRAAFRNIQHGLQTRAEVPAPSSQAVVKVDRIFFLGSLDENKVQTILEFKRPGFIRRDEWADLQQASNITKKYSQKLRMYASRYKCPQVCIFDGITLVRIDFVAITPTEIKNTQKVLVEVAFDQWIENNGPLKPARETPNAGTVRAVLFDSLLSGIRRLTVRTEIQRSLTYNGHLYKSTWERWSGSLYWVKQDEGTIHRIKPHSGFLHVLSNPGGGTRLMFCERFDEGTIAISSQV